MVDIVSAAQAGLGDLVRNCIEEGADVNAASEAGLTPLMGAVLGDHVELVRFLIDQGADVNASPVGGRSVLDMARQRNSDWLAKKLYNFPYEPYAPIRRQMLRLLRKVNRARKRAGLPILPSDVLPLRRRVVRPFGDRPPLPKDLPDARRSHVGGI